MRPRRGVARERRTLRQRAEGLLLHPSFGWGVLVTAVFVLLCGSIAAWTREQPLVAQGRVATETRVVRAEIVAENEARTEDARRSARQRTPRVFQALENELEEIRLSVERLPERLGAAGALSEVDRGLRGQFGLDAARFEAIRGFAAGEAERAAWTRQVGLLDGILRRNPLLSGPDWQRAAEGQSSQIELLVGGQSQLVPRDQAINLDDLTAARGALLRLIGNATFAGPAAEAVLTRLTASPRPTFVHDPQTTQARQDAAAGEVQPVVDRYAKGQRIFARGDVLTAENLRVYKLELDAFAAQAPAWRIWTRRLSAIGAVSTVGLVLAGYVATFAPRIAARPRRMAIVAGIVAAAFVVACVGTVGDPRLVALLATAPPVLVAVLMVIAYDQRTAVAIGSLTALLVCVGLGLPIGTYGVMLLGLGVAAWRLPEIRDHTSLVSMGAWTAAALALGQVLVGLIDRPIVPQALTQTVGDAMLAGFGGLLVGGVGLFTLRGVERAFDVTTGMRLIELRDPKHPLLRLMQQRAPGTYNHSLNVATIAESAADAIGADALLTYAGALYHDCGKISKPEYFVENQSAGRNKHDKLSPEMSVLVIVGHVKDGLETARQHDLPRPLHHFIEGHHGTTLVEFFYRRAKAQADADGDGVPDSEDARLPSEIDYRYPGPKPQTKECAILMLADAVESAARSMSEPTPSRIDGLVRSLAEKRLADGQFDECDLTLRELQTIVESISGTMASIYHGRIAYTSDEKKEKARADKKEKTA